MKRWAVSVLTVSLAGTAFHAGCGFGESGVAPPLDRIFLPGGLAADPAGRWLYVNNSNSDLRYNAGTLVAVDLAAAAEDRRRTDWPDCSSPGYLAEDQGNRFCCRDYFDPAVLNCKDTGYVNRDSTVQLGSFGASMVIERRPGQPENERRLYLAVRAEPSVTFVDATVSDTGVAFRCRSTEDGQRNPLCDDSHKVLGETDPEKGPRLPEEPYQLVLDEDLRLLFVAHATESLSLIDVCTERPSLAAVRRPVFDQIGQWVTSLVQADPGKAEGEIYVTGRDLYDSSTGGVRTLHLRGAEACTGDPRPGLTIVPGRTFYPSAFFSSGTDVRGMLLSPDNQRAFVLHRNGGRINDPQALVAIDRTADVTGQPGNTSQAIVEVCAGATQMSWHQGPRGLRIFIVCFEAGQIYVVDPDLMTISAVVNIGRGPNTAVFSIDGTAAYVTGFVDNNVSVVDLAPGSPTEYRVIQRIGFPQLRGR